MKTIFFGINFFGLTIGLLLSIINLNAQKTATASGNWSAGATWTPVGAPTAGQTVTIPSSITVTLNANTASLASLTIDNGGTLTSTAANTLTATTITLNGTLTRGSTGNITVTTMTVGSTGKYTHAINAGTIPTATWNAASTVEVTGIVGTVPGGLSQTFGNFTWDCASQNGAINLSGSPTTVNGNFSILNTNSGSLQYAASDATLSVSGNFIMSNGTFGLVGGNNNNVIITLSNNFNLSGGTLDMVLSGNPNTSSIINVGGDFTHSGGTITKTNNRTSTIVFNKAGTQIFRSGGTVTGSIDFTVNSGSLLQMFDATSSVTGSGTFTLSSGATIGVTSAVGITTSGATGNIQTSNRSYSAGANYIYNGTANQVIGNGFPNNLTGAITINNIGNVVTLDNPRTIASGGKLTLTNGILATTLTNLLTIAAGGSSSGGSASSHVNGPLAKIGSTNFSFPIGNGTFYRPIDISVLSTSLTFTARYFQANPRTTFSNTLSGIDHIGICEYWTLDRTEASGNAIVQLNFGGSCNGAPYVTNPPTLLVARYTGAGGSPANTWVNEGNTASSMTSVKSGSLSNFSPFTIGSLDGQNPLPVKFTDVKAFEKGNTVQIEWINQTENDVLNYQIERSANGVDFAVLNEVSAKGNLGSKESYLSFDDNPYKGVNYYRIKAVELNGKVIYTKILKVILGDVRTEIRLYPNPVSGNTIAIGFTANKGQYILRVINGIGQELMSKSFIHQGGTLSQVINLPATIKKGMFNLLISGDNYNVSKMFLVQ